MLVAFILASSRGSRWKRGPSRPENQSGKAALRSFRRGNDGLFAPMPEKENNIKVVNPLASVQPKYDMDRAIGDTVVKKLKGCMGKYRQ